MQKQRIVTDSVELSMPIETHIYHFNCGTHKMLLPPS